jgi:hypothetical protein
MPSCDFRGLHGRKDRALALGRNERTWGSGASSRVAVRRSFRNAIPMTDRRAVARARIASATAISSTAYCESSTSCRSSRICLCIARPRSVSASGASCARVASLIRQALDGPHAASASTAVYRAKDGHAAQRKLCATSALASTSSMFAYPLNAIARSRSARKLRSTSATPSAPPSARPHT